MLYQVEIIETLSRIVDIDAESWEEAGEIAREQWDIGRVVLGADDFEKVDFKVIDD